MTDIDALDLLVCNGCGRSFTSIDGPGMVRALKGPCPDCGGRFELVEDFARLGEQYRRDSQDASPAGHERRVQ